MTSETGCNPCAELHCPGADRPTAHINSTIGEDLFCIVPAEREAEVEPNGVLNVGWREAAPLVGNSRQWGSPNGQSPRPPPAARWREADSMLFIGEGL